MSAFKEQIDLASNVHPGDQFQLLYQPTVNKSGKPASIEILAARFITHNKTYEVVRYEDPEGHIAYYKPDGKSMKSGFLRIPVENSHVSSGFTFSRIDPIFNIARPHLGVDFAAPMGSPIKATSDGKVIFLGQKNGYGNTIIIKHDEHYSALYAHLQAFADSLQTGSIVHQGQIIGKVGCNGHSTGPHLHYEFWVDGARRDPLTVELPKSSAIPKHYLAKFTNHAHYLLAQLDASQHVQLAANTGKKSNKSKG
jgi:murein DD-endopeptidase MepM/ murein hydrolase activator NlpD